MEESEDTINILISGKQDINTFLSILHPAYWYNIFLYARNVSS